MKRRYLIDGYNLLMRWRRGRIKPGPGNLERARDALVAWLERRVRDDDLTVVFDARLKAPGRTATDRAARVRIVFASEHHSADEWIIQECSQSAGQPVTVVTNDWEIQAAARRSSALVLSCDDFLAQLLDPPQNAGPTAPSQPVEETKELAFTESDLARFRDEMSRDAAPESPTDLQSTVPPNPSGGVPAPTESDLEDFYRRMRAEKFDLDS